MTIDTIDKTLEQAIAHHRRGELQDAERLYRAVLRIQPDHPDANHNLGVIAVQMKLPELGLPYFNAALEANPKHDQYWLSYIDALNQAGHSDVARQVIERRRQRELKADRVGQLADCVEGGARITERPRAQIEGTSKEAISALPAGLQDGRKENRCAPPERAFGNPAARAGKNPDIREMDELVRLFTQGQYAEVANRARTMTEYFPAHAFGWKMLGAVLRQTGRSPDALAAMRTAAALSPNDFEVHNILGVTLCDLGQPGEAEASYRKALQIEPGSANAHFNLGNTLKNLGRLGEAEASYRQAIRIHPDYANAYYNLGVTLENLGRQDEAEASYRGALRVRPDHANAHYNLGNILRNLGRPGEAEASYRRALEIGPDHADAHNNLGNTLRNLGRLDEAETSYRRALHIEPDHIDALNNLASLLSARGDTTAALGIIKQSLRIKETESAKSIFVDCIKRSRFKDDDDAIRAVMIRALTEPWGRPGYLARAGADLVKLNPDIEACMARATRAWPARLRSQDPFGTTGLAALAVDPLLRALLNSAPICDIRLERILTIARHAMLESAAGATAADDEVGTVLGFYCALACQCFINEYVFSQTADETQEASELRDALIAALNAETEVPALWLVAVAAYFPLCSLPNAARLLDARWPEAVSEVLVQQVREPGAELKLRATIPRLFEIEDEVSLQVQRQYEENPYPRWVKAAPSGKSTTIAEYLCSKFPLASFERHGKSSIDFLIAGCGTGQHSIERAQQFVGARILAVDLSLSSLGYAKRKTRELGLTSIEYAQGDILKLDSLGRSFDVIESVGVLHHLSDPWGGWRILLSLLRPGGFMKLGLYSEVARRNVVRARTAIARRGYAATAEGIRRCRQDLLHGDRSADFETSLKSSDFFSISACRDLLFHVQEHHVTLAGIAAFLRENNLAFLGFDLDAEILHAYRQRFPDDRAATDLVHWQVFENEYPDTFISMYQFWIQMPGHITPIRPGRSDPEKLPQ